MNSVLERLQNIYARLQSSALVKDKVVSTINLTNFTQVLNSAIAMSDLETTIYEFVRELQKKNGMEFHKYLVKSGQQYLLLCSDGKLIASNLEIDDFVRINYNRNSHSFTVDAASMVPVIEDRSETAVSERPWKTRNNKIFESVDTNQEPNFYTKQEPKNYSDDSRQPRGYTTNQYNRNDSGRGGYGGNNYGHNSGNNGGSSGGSNYISKFSNNYAGRFGNESRPNRGRDNNGPSKYDKNADRNAARNADRSVDNRNAGKNDGKIQRNNPQDPQVIVEKIEVPKRTKEKKVSLLKPLTASVISRALAESQLIPEENRSEIKVQTRSETDVKPDETPRQMAERISWSEDGQ